jgi:hypothetical protein
MRCRFTLRTTSPPDKLQHPLAIHQHDITSDGAFPVALSGSTTARGTDLCQPALDLSLASLKLLFQTWGEGLARWGDRYCNNGPANEKAVQLPPIPCDGPFIWIDQGPSERTLVCCCPRPLVLPCNRTLPLTPERNSIRASVPSERAPMCVNMLHPGSLSEDV